jgi:hypothetical protein
LAKLFLASLALISVIAIARSTLVGSFHGSASNNKARVVATETLPAASEAKSLFLLGIGLMGFAGATLLLKSARQPAAVPQVEETLAQQS